MLLLRLHNDHFLIACNLPSRGPATFSVFWYHISFCKKAFSYLFPPLNYVLQIHFWSWGNVHFDNIWLCICDVLCRAFFFTLLFISAYICARNDDFRSVVYFVL